MRRDHPNPFRKLPSILIAACGLMLASCASTRPVANVPLAPPEPYTRIAHPDTNTVQLQIAVRKFLPTHHRGPVVWLAGTSHIGDPDYYRALQKHLDAQTLVLFEGVNAGTHKRHVRKSAESPITSPPAKSTPGQPDASEPPGIQTTMAKSLGLVFQLDAINYDRLNFLNSDLSIQQIQRLIAGRAADAPDASASAAGAGEPAAGNASFQNLMQAMDGSSFLGSVMRMGLHFIGSSAKLQAITKLAFIEVLGELKGNLTAMKGMPPDMQQLIQVLIEARNRTVIEDLKTESKLIPRSGSIAIFYGTGHMDDMEKRLTGDLHYHPAGELWLTAFSVELHQTGLSASELAMVQNLIKYQMSQLQQ
ncbi:MAG: hypothetical protein JWR69_3338 [Pedosphaera sp.]|nr:hypothetical protein [Pedosphaera sp.]